MGERGVREGRGDDTGVQRTVAGLAVLPNTLAGRRRVFRTRREEAQPEVEMRSAELLLPAPAGVGASVAVTAARGEEGQGQLCVVPAPRVGEQVERRSRKEWANQRALAMLRRNRAVEEERIEEGVRPRSRWRRFVERISGLS
jgi:hypothetical protein